MQDLPSLPASTNGNGGTPPLTPTTPRYDANGCMGHRRTRSSDGVPRIRLGDSECSGKTISPSNSLSHLDFPETFNTSGTAPTSPAKSTSNPERKRYGFSDQKILDCLSEATTPQALAARSHLIKVVGDVSGGQPEESVGGGAVKTSTLDRRSKSLAGLLSPDTSKSAFDAPAQARSAFVEKVLSRYASVPRNIVEMYRQWIFRSEIVSEPKTEVPARPNPDASRGEYCIPVEVEFTRDGEKEELTEEQLHSLIDIDAITHNIALQLTTSEEVQADNNRKMVGDLERSNLTVCMELGKDCQAELYSTKVHRGYLDRQIASETDPGKKAELANSRKQEVANMVDYWIEKLCPGFQAALPGLVRQDLMNQPYCAFTEQFKIHPTNKSKGDEGTKIYLKVINEDEVEITASALFDRYQVPGEKTKKTHKASILHQFTVRMVRDGRIWVPVFVRCKFATNTNKKALGKQQKSASHSPQSLTPDELKLLDHPMSKTKRSMSDLKKLTQSPELSHATHSAGKDKPDYRRSFSLTPPQMSPMAPVHMRQFSDSLVGQAEMTTSLQTSTATSASSIYSASSEDSSLPPMHTRQRSDLSDTVSPDMQKSSAAVSSTSTAPSPSPYANSKMHCLTVSGQLYMTNMDDDAATRQIRDNLVIDSYKKLLARREAEWTMEARPREGRAAGSESAKLSTKLSKLLNDAPSEYCFDAVKKQAMIAASDSMKAPVDALMLSEECTSELAKLRDEYTQRWEKELERVQKRVLDYKVAAEVDSLPDISFPPRNFQKMVALEEKLAGLKQDYLAAIKALSDEAEKPLPANPAERREALRRLTEVQATCIKCTRQYKPSGEQQRPPVYADVKDIGLTSPMATPSGQPVQTYMEVRKAELSVLATLASTRLFQLMNRMKATTSEAERATYEAQCYLIRNMFNTGLTIENFNLMMEIAESGGIQQNDRAKMVTAQGKLAGIKEFCKNKLEKLVEGHYLTIGELNTLENEYSVPMTDILSAISESSYSENAPANMAQLHQTLCRYLDSDEVTDEEALTVVLFIQNHTKKQKKHSGNSTPGESGNH